MRCAPAHLSTVTRRPMHVYSPARNSNLRLDTHAALPCSALLRSGIADGRLHILQSTSCLVSALPARIWDRPASRRCLCDTSGNACMGAGADLPRVGWAVADSWCFRHVVAPDGRLSSYVAAPAVFHTREVERAANRPPLVPRPRHAGSPH